VGAVELCDERSRQPICGNAFTPVYRAQRPSGSKAQAWMWSVPSAQCSTHSRVERFVWLRSLPRRIPGRANQS